ncbi:MAG TPA: hypothetical protein VGG10_17325 [Rhizomicrobium sp.]|jgi:acetyl-CoA C-acetyltransferase
MPAADRVPVIVGVGQFADHTERNEDALDTVGLLVAALRKADQDAGGGWLARAQSLHIVDHLSFRDPKSTERVTKELGIAPRLVGRGSYPGGETPVLLLNEAANRIGAGELDVALIAGGEALRTEARRRGYGVFAAPPRTEQRTTPQPLRVRYGLMLPTNVYPLYENATRAAFGQTLAGAQTESGLIWSVSSEVAAQNPNAWIQKAYTPSEILTPTAENRPIAFPYNKLMVANSSVNMAGAVIVTSLASARAAGVPEDRLIYVGLGAAANEPDNFLEREGYDRSVSMEVSLKRCLELNQIAANELDHVELYSCFPVIPKLARRILGWPAGKPTTVYGGLTFGGGPIGAPMIHAIACMVEKLRVSGNNGLVFGNGGFANHNHTIMLTRSANAAAVFPQDFDFQSEADAARTGAPAYEEGYAGQGVIESYTVFYDRTGATTFGVVVGRTIDGSRRFLAKVPAEDREELAFLTTGEHEPVGTTGQAFATDDGDIVWRSE